VQIYVQLDKASIRVTWHISQLTQKEVEDLQTGKLQVIITQ
jgi:hypothetical protein